MRKILSEYAAILSGLFSVLSGSFFVYQLITKYMTMANFLLLLIFAISCLAVIWTKYNEFRENYTASIDNLRSYIDQRASGLDQKIEQQSKNLLDHLIKHDKKQLSE
ncbi:MAG TPA: hypothetical protein ACFYD2_02615 [Candidatus Avalokitesvara rifleensis]|uniref:hypothetical protein n=1 Tax=Candidatus Avalokitesvara rifleensis TaxID=3367620 RepID=UPI0027132FBB|nr:hypothetical protein [Candidatus Brocadiales bacterium]